MTDLISQIEAAAALGAKARTRPDNGMIARVEQADHWDAYACAAANLPLAAIAEKLRRLREIEREAVLVVERFPQRAIMAPYIKSLKAALAAKEPAND